MKRNYYRESDWMFDTDKKNPARNARVRQVKRQKMFFIMGVLITMAFISFFSVRTFANTDNTVADSFGTKQYRSIKIYCGDTVESIARDNFSFQYSTVDKLADEIMSINHISADDKLIPGNYLVIPYFDMAVGY